MMHLYRFNQSVSHKSRPVNILFGVRASRQGLFEPFRTRFSTTPPTLNTDEDKRLDHLSKRKIALVAGYLGSGYHGVQLNDDVPTIENEIRKSLLAAGCIRESNYEDLAKIGWTRSSRTDKGVHAGCIVFGGKLLVDEAKVHKTTGRVLELTEALNQHLPETIRIFSATKVNKKFSARKACVLREYEYFMPLSFFMESSRLTSKEFDSDENEFDIEEAIEKFHTTLRKYAGIHDFHNFTKSRSYFYRVHHEKMQYKKQKQLEKATEGQLLQQQAAADDDEEEEEEEEVEVEVEEEDNEEVHDEYSVEADRPYRQDVTEQTRDLLPRHRRAVYACSGSLVQDFYGEKFLRVHIVGQAFLLNQIRCMVGGALAVATGNMSEELFDAALKTNRIVRVPIAPAEGLVLLSSTFGGKLHSVSLYEDPNTKLATSRKDVEHRMLLNPKEDQAMAQFRQDIIYPEVVQAWKSETEMDRWKAYLERVYEHHTHLNMDEIKQALAQIQVEEQTKKQKQHTTVQQRRQDVVTHTAPRSLVPKQFTTKICVRYSVAPGIFTADLRRGVAKHLKDGKLPLDVTEEGIFQYIDAYGVDILAEEGKLIRLNVEAKKPLPPPHLAPGGDKQKPSQPKRRKPQRPRPGWKTSSNQ